MRRLAVNLAAALLLLAAFGGSRAATAVRAAPATSAPKATLDPNFGDRGLLALPPEKLEPESPIFAITAKGDIVFGGALDLRLLTAAGKPAAIYGGQGTLALPQPEGGEFRPSAIAIDPQGRLLVVGTSRFPPATETTDATRYLHEVEPASVRLIRYLPDGALDPAFGAGGIVESDLGLGPPRREGGEPIIQEPSVSATGVAVDAQGRIAVTGGALVGFGESCAHDIFNEVLVAAGFVARLSEAGALDQGFGRDGVVGGRSLDENPLRAEEVGKPVVAPGGAITYLSTRVDPCNPRYGLVQLTADGRIRKRLGKGGAIRGYFTSLAQRADGSVVAVAGEGWSGNEPYIDRVIRIRPDGARDRTFGHRGRALVRLGHGLGNDTGSVAVDPEGRILLAGTFANHNGRRMVLIRLSAKGRQERDFGPKGRVTTPFPTLVTTYSVAVTATASMFDPQGRLVTVHRYSTSQGSAPVLARYLLAN
jgi:uncharacterized delta-60 repeat protein